MGMIDNVFDIPSIEDMPAGYPDIRNRVKLIGMSIRDHKQMISLKLLAYSGIQNISVENINKNNSMRLDLYRDFIRLGFPYIKWAENKEPASPKDEREGLIEEYKRLFLQQPQENETKQK